MNDYRIFAGAFLEGELAERVQTIRQKYDPVTARITPPHVTLAGTYWRSGPPTPENEAEAVRRLEILPGILLPYDLLLKGVRTFPGERPVVYLSVEINKGLIEARNLLLGMFGPDKHKDFRPHLTLAMRLPWEGAWQMVNDLQASEWNTQLHKAPIREVRLMQRGPRDKAWRCIYRLNLEA
ncbi:MAG: 2'-5' RNA ligase family protein [Chloroflexi bacterium]|nr:MAG: 2'-5' RNA ligase family protein [Chloroflexota bacterium]